MTPEQNEVLKRIENAPLVSVDGDLLFTRKLAQQNGWTIKKAISAIKEYRRFLFLAMETGHPVSPSDAVDQVWHLHLMYTTEYWKVYCPEVLGRPFHHHPSAGGPVEREKFEDWYRATLESYRTFFGEEPPREFWPEPEVKSEMDGRVHRRVDLAEHWVIAKPELLRKGLLRPALGLALPTVMLVAGSGCAAIGQVFPWDMEGPTFLQFFIGMLIASWISAYMVRQSRRIPETKVTDTLPELNVYEMAYLAGGTRRLTQALLGKLAGAGAIEIDEKTKEIIKAKEWEMGGELEDVAMERVRGQALREFQEEVQAQFEPCGERLKRLGLLVPDCAQGRLILLPFLIAALPVAVGGIKLYFGIMRGRPVEFLIMLLVIAGAVALGFCQKAFRSKKGDAMLARLKRENDHVREELHNSAAQPQNAGLVCLAVALFGAEALASTPYAHLQARLGPASSSSGGCGAGCGGGSGCGGGGCGGCGGCG